MKTVGVRALRENPGLLSQCAASGELLLVTNRSDLISIAMPFNDDLLRAGVQVHLAIKLYEEGVLTLVKAAQLAQMPVEQFLQTLALLDITVVDQDAEELCRDLAVLET